GLACRKKLPGQRAGRHSGLRLISFPRIRVKALHSTHQLCRKLLPPGHSGPDPESKFKPLHINFWKDLLTLYQILQHHLSEIRDETRAFGAKAIEQIQSIVIGMIPDHWSAVFHCRSNRDTMVENSVRIFQRFGFGYQVLKPLCTRLYILYFPGIVSTQPDFIPPDGYVKGRLFDDFIQNGTF